MQLKPQILVVDDNADVLEALRLLLKGAGYAVVSADAPAQALTLLKAQPLDLVLMDLNYARDTTSGQEGRDLLFEIRSLDSVLPVVAMTAWGSVELAVELMQYGLNDFVQKPWDNARLLATLQHQLQVGGAKRDALRQADLVSAQQAREWAAARQMQEALLPRSLPVFDGYEVAAHWQPMHVVGGDWYDVAKIEDDHLALGIGDVTGKGLPAALLMANLQALVKARESTEVSPAQLCSEINQVLCRNLEAGKFITLFYALLDLKNGVLRYCNAGHNPPLLVRSNGRVELLQEGGALLGAFSEWVYSQGETFVNPGDRLLCYTDGVTEATNISGDEYGESRLSTWVAAQRGFSAANIQEKLLAELLGFHQGVNNDDATVLVLGRN